MRREIAILANSFRDNDRCIAGIDVNTGEWVRPVSPPEGGAIGWGMRNIGGREPELLDIVEVSVQNSGPDLGCQPENRLVMPVPWQHSGLMPVEEVLGYCEADEVLLHNDDDYVEAGFFETLPRAQWKSLQLIHPAVVEFHGTSWEGRTRWRAAIQYGTRKHLDLGLTDPVLIERLNVADSISRDCLLTVSLAGPWLHPASQTMRCYKLVAGVIELEQELSG